MRRVNKSIFVVECFHRKIKINKIMDDRKLIR